MSDDDRFNVHDGKEQRIDARRTLRVKAVRKGQLIAASPQARENYDRIFGQRKPADLAAAPADVVQAKKHFCENFDRIFRATSARDESTTNGRES